jgi:hypothetical protein
MKPLMVCVATLFAFGALGGTKAENDLQGIAAMVVYDANCVGYALVPIEVKLWVKAYSELYPRELPMAVTEIKRTIFDKIGKAEFCTSFAMPFSR